MKCIYDLKSALYLMKSHSLHESYMHFVAASDGNAGHRCKKLLEKYLCCRLLRDKWQTMNDQLTDHQQQMKDSLFQISTHEENLTEFCAWLQEAESKVKRDSDLQPTLQAKRALLQHVKVIE